MAALASGWAGLVWLWRGGDATTVALTFVAPVAAVAASRWITRRFQWVVATALWALPAGLTAVSLVDRTSRQGLLGYANASALLLFVSALGGLVLAEQRPHPLLRVAAWAYAGLCALVVLGIGADTAFALFVLLPAVAALPVSAPALRRLLVGGGLVVLASLGAIVVAGIDYDPADRTGAVSQIVDRALSERRVALWHDAVEQVSANPLTGVGPHRFAELSPTARGDPDTPWVHNELLQLAAELGVVGTALGFAMFVWCGAVLWRSEPSRVTVLASAGLIGVAVDASIDYVLHFPAIVLATACLIGAASVSLPRARHQAEPARQPAALR